MYSLQDFMNTLSNAGSLIYITKDGEPLFKGKQLDFSILEASSEYMDCKVWRIGIVEAKYLWADIS